MYRGFQHEEMLTLTHSNVHISLLGIVFLSCKWLHYNKFPNLRGNNP